MRIPAKKQSSLAREKSNYHAREAYLEAMKRFMIDEESSDAYTTENILEYFLYEEHVSHDLQKLLDHVHAIHGIPQEPE